MPFIHGGTTPEIRRTVYLAFACILSSVAFQSCTPPPIKNCPSTPGLLLDEANVKQIPMDEGRNFLLAGELSENELKGYTFTINEPNKGRRYRLYIRYNPNVCIWISDPSTSTVPFNTPFLIDKGKYVVQMAPLDKKITPYYLHGTLSEEKDKPTVAPETSGKLPESFSEAKPFSQMDEQSRSLNSPESNLDLFKGIALSLSTNIFSDILLVLFGCFGITSIRELIKRRKDKKEAGRLWQFWVNSYNFSLKEFKSLLKSEKYHIVFSVDFEQAKSKILQNATESKRAIEPQFKYAHAFGVYQVKNFIESYLTRDAVVLHPQKMGSHIDNKIFRENVIILGWRHGILGFDNFLNGLETPHYYDKDGQLVARRGSEIRKPNVRSNGTVESDFGSLIRIVHPQTGKLIILFDAHYGLGILGLTKLMTTLIKRPNPNSSLLKDIVDKVNRSKQGCHLIITVTNSGNEDILDSNDILYRMSTCEHFDISEDTLLTAIKAATRVQTEKNSSFESDLANG